MQKSQFLSALLIIILAGLLVLGYPFLHSQVPFLQANFKTYSLDQFYTPRIVKSYELDSLQGFDSLAMRTPVVDSNANVSNYDYDVSNIKLEDYHGRALLSPFYETLNSKKQQIRIAYFGDSSIEGDLISQTVRDSLQRRYGGNGVGFVPIISKTNGFRKSVRHLFSKNWYHCFIGKKNTQNKRRGISGEYFLSYSQVTYDTIQIDSLGKDSIIVNAPDGNYWVSYRPTKLNPGTNLISSARLFYGTPNFNDTTAYSNLAGSVTIKTDSSQKVAPLSYESMVNQVELTDAITNKLILNFKIPSSLPLYGVSLESKDGIILDNFSSRGNLGPGLRYISNAILQDFQYYLNYDLIILQFGLNVTNPDLKEFSWYERDMIKTVNHFKTALPGIPILIIGPPDKSRKLGGKMRTDPSVPLINQCLQKVAKKTEVAFFSLYEAMGGENSMVEWVEKKRPKLANNDYTHFNFKGAEVAGNLVLDFLLENLEEE